jgi:hypothetical protein
MNDAIMHTLQKSFIKNFLMELRFTPRWNTSFLIIVVASTDKEFLSFLGWANNQNRGCLNNFFFYFLMKMTIQGGDSSKVRMEGEKSR